MIKITSKLHGVEVAGMRHPAMTVNYADAQISDEQLAEFMQSEYLTVDLDGESVERLAEVENYDNATDDGEKVAEATRELAEPVVELEPIDPPEPIAEPKPAATKKTAGKSKAKS